MSRPDATQIAALCDEASTAIARIARDAPVICRRAAAGGLADGYPATSGPAGGGGGDGTSSTERIALDRWDAEHQASLNEEDRRAARPDPVRRSAENMTRALADAVAALRSADGSRDAVVGRAAQPTPAAIGTRSAAMGSCGACDGPAWPLHAGMCSTCFDVWCLAGRPERAAFGTARRAALAGGRLAAALRRAPIPPSAALSSGSRSAACVLCGHDPACGRATAFDSADRPRALCDASDHSCYARWTVAGERPKAAA